MDADTLDDKLVTDLEARIAADRARVARIRARAAELTDPVMGPLVGAMKRRASELELMIRAHEAIHEGLTGQPGRAAA